MTSKQLPALSKSRTTNLSTTALPSGVKLQEDVDSQKVSVTPSKTLHTSQAFFLLLLLKKDIVSHYVKLEKGKA